VCIHRCSFPHLTDADTAFVNDPAVIDERHADARDVELGSGTTHKVEERCHSGRIQWVCGSACEGLANKACWAKACHDEIDRCSAFFCRALAAIDDRDGPRSALAPYDAIDL